MAKIFPNLKETDIQEQKHRGFKQDESKQTHTKIYHN